MSTDSKVQIVDYIRQLYSWLETCYEVVVYVELLNNEISMGFCASRIPMYALNSLYYIVTTRLVTC